jgi:hypothetical protein
MVGDFHEYRNREGGVDQFMTNGADKLLAMNSGVTPALGDIKKLLYLRVFA